MQASHLPLSPFTVVKWKWELEFLTWFTYLALPGTHQAQPRHRPGRRVDHNKRSALCAFLGWEVTVLTLPSTAYARLWSQTRTCPWLLDFSRFVRTNACQKLRGEPHSEPFFWRGRSAARRSGLPCRWQCAARRRRGKDGRESAKLKRACFTNVGQNAFLCSWLLPPSAFASAENKSASSWKRVLEPLLGALCLCGSLSGLGWQRAFIYDRSLFPPFFHLSSFLPLFVRQTVVTGLKGEGCKIPASRFIASASVGGNQRVSFLAVSFRLVLVGTLLPNRSGCFTANSNTDHVFQSCYHSTSYSDVPFTIVLGLILLFSVQ